MSSIKNMAVILLIPSSRIINTIEDVPELFTSLYRVLDIDASSISESIQLPLEEYLIWECLLKN